VAPAQSVQRRLQETGLSEKELAKLDGGEPLVWIPKADDATEVTLLAAVRIETDPTRLTGMVRDVLGLVERNDQVMQAGMFSVDPVAADASSLRLPDGDVKDLGKCKPGSCNLKFPAEALNAVQGQVEGAEQAKQFMAEWLASYLFAYQQRGGEGPDMLVVVKQIHASHYIQAGVKVYVVLPVSDTDPSQGVYVMLTQRLRFDGEVKGIKRSALESGAKRAANSQLKSFKAYAEAAG
jgi:hypothetical protein